MKPGAHLAALGADLKGEQELDPRILQRGRVFVDDIRQCREDGEINVALSEGLITEDDVAGEIGKVICGELEGRQSDDQVTVFDSTGIALQDSATVPLEYERAVAAGVGVEKKMISTPPAPPDHRRPRVWAGAGRRGARGPGGGARPGGAWRESGPSPPPAPEPAGEPRCRCVVSAAGVGGGRRAAPSGGAAGVAGPRAGGAPWEDPRWGGVRGGGGGVGHRRGGGVARRVAGVDGGPTSRSGRAHGRSPQASASMARAMYRAALPSTTGHCDGRAWSVSRRLRGSCLGTLELGSFSHLPASSRQSS